MKKIKMYLSVAVFAMVGVVGYSTYTNATMSEAERLMIENVEALTNDESVGSNCKVLCYSATDYYCNIAGGTTIVRCGDRYPR